MDEQAARKRAEDSAALCRSPGCEDELWDVYDDAGRKTGALHRRGDPLAPGEKHLCVHVWIRDPAGDYLITRRAPGKSLPGLWECTGGCALAGEDGLTAALREVREETGLALDPADGELLLRWTGEFFLCDVFLFRRRIDPAALTLQPAETEAARLAPLREIRALQKAGQFVPWDYIDTLPEG